MTLLNITLATAQSSFAISSRAVIPLLLWVTGFLCVLNIGLAIFYRKNKLLEVATYWIACAFQLALFVAGLLVLVGIIKTVPFTLPANLPFNQSIIAAALAIGIGLFPAAYWHKVNVSDLPKRIAEDGKVMKGKQANVRVRGNGPGEWLNS